MRQLAIYGKGGIGKSMVSSHITFALANKGLRVLHVGCDPKHDSTRLLLKGKMPRTVLGTLRKKDFDVKNLTMDEVIYESELNDLCSGHIFSLLPGTRPKPTMFSRRSRWCCGGCSRNMTLNGLSRPGRSGSRVSSFSNGNRKRPVLRRSFLMKRSS